MNKSRRQKGKQVLLCKDVFFEFDLVALWSDALQERRIQKDQRNSTRRRRIKNETSTLLYFFLEILSSGSVVFITRGGSVVRKYKAERDLVKGHANNSNEVTARRRFRRDTRKRIVAPYSQSKLSVMPKYLFASERDWILKRQKEREEGGGSLTS